jgi:anti-sigma factor RsiW
MPTSRRSSCDVTALADHARGLGSEADRARVDAHVSDCTTCRAGLAALARLAAVARTDATEVPGRAALQRAMAIAHAAVPDPVSLLPRWLGQMIDTGWKPAQAGLRSAAAQDQRQGLFHAGPYAVRVRVEDEPRETTCTVLGQIEARGRERDVAALPVLISVGARVLARTDTNDHGEFEVSCEAMPQLRLQVVVEGGARRVDLPLARLLASSPEPS